LEVGEERRGNIASEMGEDGEEKPGIAVAIAASCDEMKFNDSLLGGELLICLALRYLLLRLCLCSETIARIARQRNCCCIASISVATLSM
jgi:hypothetical protein